ncbi:hypothetical protein CASFOL_022064 [Castilleja foliolosa]|uniref:BHLH domain-containing protein n=1 Tax=Castilleja foliolosa TaxID=1961234 RepID=A0ABD3CYE0_9LAMI
MNNNNNNMFPSSTSQGQVGGGLMRYGSAPSSVLSTALDSFSSAFATQTQPQPAHDEPASAALRRSNYTCLSSSSSPSPSLVRHSSLPTAFNSYDYLPAATTDNGFSITSGNNHSHVSRLNSQLSYSHGTKESLSRISEETDNINTADVDDTTTDHHHHHHRIRNAQKRSSHRANFSTGVWDDNQPLTFSVSPNNTINSNGPHHDTIESQFQFGMPHATLELATMDKLMNIPQDSVPCKIRAKRGFATHPRSIAERERRMRISGKLKKLQDLVPNMDKQTSYADMLDLAVQHIKSLQHDVQKLNNELDGCQCGCKEK